MKSALSKIALFSLLFFSIVSQVDAEEILNLQECIALALAQNSAVKMVEFDLKDAEMELAKLRLEDLSRIPRRELAEKEQGVAQIKERLTATRRRVALEVESKYYQVLKALQTVDSKKRSLEWLEKQRQIALVKFQSGLIAEKDLKAVEARLTDGEKDYTLSCFALTTARMELNLLLGWELEREFKLADEEFPFIPLTVDLQSTIANTVKYSAGVKQATADLAEARAALEMKQKMGVSSLELTFASHTVAKAELRVTEARKEAVIQGRNIYASLSAGSEAVLSARKAHEACEHELEVLRLKYAAGMIALNELLEASSRLAEAETRMIQAIYDYNLAKANYQETVGFEGSDKYE